MLSHGTPPTPSAPLPDKPAHDREAPPSDGAPSGKAPEPAWFNGGPDGRPCRLLHVEPVPVVRAGIEAQFANLAGLELLPAVEDPRAALGQLDSEPPDLLLTEIAFEQVDGLEWLKTVCQGRRTPRVVVFTSLPVEVFGSRARRAGAWAFVGKEAAFPLLIGILSDVARGRKRFPTTPKPPHGSLCHAVGQLSDRELAVFQMLGHGHSTKEVASLLGRSPKTVETHRVHLMRKLGVESINALIRVAVRWLDNPNGSMP